ncbi:peptidoglycan -binding protein [Sabulicella glaciei]|uniref:Peptidoglycan -binding protein n=1 Tax=Sabulicella glaciei TaxID=2984948 RepID=A0ABT3NW08_9PROT|nr:peptidoglycan -binding protein [Roseococcus sp. MDT2-1-1]MCW8086351.1 peptidoglycan -binding protein [Roseococcus sp. MDT2-1-1]
MARARRGGIEPWPGYVDALSTLLMVTIFVLLVFVLAQGFLSSALSTRDQALERLNRQAAELAEMLALERTQAEELRGLLSRAADDLRAATGARDTLSAQLRAVTAAREQGAAEAASLRTERDRLAARLADLDAARAGTAQRLTGAEAQLTEALRRAEAATGEAARTVQRLNEQGRELAAERDALANERAARSQADARIAEQTRAITAERAARSAAETRLAETERRARDSEGALETARADLATLRRLQAEALAQLEQARRDVAALREAEAALNRTVRADRATIEARLADLARLQGEITRLTALRDEAERQARAALARAGEEERQRRAGEAEAQRLSESARAEIALLNRQLDELRGQLNRLANALDAAQSRDRESEAQVVNLRAQLNAALAQRVEELQRYRSEFFGRLREVLGDRPEVRVVGDRFVFQSEVLFPPASADLSAAGVAQIRQLSRVLLELSQRIPADVPWILRVDGHADRNPVRGGRFASNWELSAARAIAVANLMIEAGLPANRIAAAAFGENQPLDAADTPEAYARNRRIEVRLTDR